MQTNLMKSKGFFILCLQANIKKYLGNEKYNNLFYTIAMSNKKPPTLLGRGTVYYLVSMKFKSSYGVMYCEIYYEGHISV